MRGRRPSGPEYVEHLVGSAQAKERLRVVLETMAGRLRVGEACLLLKISEQRFHQLRAGLLQAALDELEPKPMGRPRRAAVPAETALLMERLAERERELEAAQVRAEIALALPQVVVEPESEVVEPEKKTRLPPKG
jgi:hypothetical protein